MAPADDDFSTSSPHALFEDYQRSNDSIHRRRLLRAIFDRGRPAADSEIIWLLLREARALVAELCSIEEAERLLLDHAHNSGFPHYCGLVPDDSRPIDPRHWGSSTSSVHYLVDWDNSCVSYIRLEVSPYGVEGVVLDLLQDYLPAEPFSLMRLARLPLHDVLALLHQHGLLPELPPLPRRSKLMASEARDVATISGTVSDASSPASRRKTSETESTAAVETPKVPRDVWLNHHLTDERQKDLVNWHYELTGAVHEIHNTMLKDPTVDAYARARNIERHPIMRRLYPSGHPSKVKKEHSNHPDTPRSAPTRPNTPRRRA